MVSYIDSIYTVYMFLMWYLSGIYIFYIFFLNRWEEYNFIMYFYVNWYVFYVNWYVFNVYWYVKFSLYEFGVLVV